MKAEGIDCMLIYGNDEFQGGASNWLNGSRADLCNYGLWYLFPIEGPGAIFGHGPYSGICLCNGLEDIEVNVSAPATPNWPGCLNDFCPWAARFLVQRGYKKLGIFRKRNNPLHFIEYLKENVPGLEICYCDDVIDVPKSIKSPDEIELIEYNNGLIKKVFDEIPGLIKAGRTEREIAVEIKAELWKQEIEYWWVNIGSGKNALPKFQQMQNRTIEEGDIVSISISATTQLGVYWGIVTRNYQVGKITPEAEKINNDSLALLDKIAGMLKPGVVPATLLDEIHAFQKENGYYETTDLFVHGIGTDIKERPVALPEETMVLAENMYIAVESRLENDDYAVSNQNCYLVTPNGGKLMTDVPTALKAV
jgi:Xaa-Pro aminopeptidase